MSRPTRSRWPDGAAAGSTWTGMRPARPRARRAVRRRGHRVGEPGEPEPGKLALLGLLPVGVDDAVALGADEPQRDGVHAVAGLDDRRDEQRGPLGRHVEAELDRARLRHAAQLAPVDEREPGHPRLVEDGPELAGLAGGQVQVLLVAVARRRVPVVVVAGA